MTVFRLLPLQCVRAVLHIHFSTAETRGGFYCEKQEKQEPQCVCH